MYIKRKNDGGSLLVTPNRREGKGLLKNIFRFSGQVYHVPSIKYLIESSGGSQDQVDAVNAFLSKLKVGDYINWDIPTEDPVLYTQDRHGNDLPAPRVSTRMYADIDLEKLDDAIAGVSEPARTSRKTAKS